MFWIYTILLFLYIYSTPVRGLPSFLTTVRIATFGLLLLFLFVKKTNGHKRPVKFTYSYHTLIRTFIFICILLVYSVILVISIGTGSGESIVPVYINMFVSSFLPTIILIRLFNSVDVFLKSVLWVTIIQTICIWLCLLVPSIKELLDSLFLYNTDHEEFREAYAGGLACITAPGAIKYSLGIVSCVYFIIKTEKIKYFVLFILLTVTATMVARTGLLIALVCLVFMLVHLFRKVSMRTVLSYSLGCVLIVYLLVLVAGNNIDFVEERFQRLLFLFEVGLNDAFLTAYFDGSTTVIPKISSETLFGLGIYSGLSGNGIYVNADGGYIKNYAAIGLILSALFYIFFYVNAIRIAYRMKSRENRLFVMMFIAVIALAEFKEWVIFDMYMICIFFTVVILLEQEGTNNKIQCYD